MRHNKLAAVAALAAAALALAGCTVVADAPTEPRATYMVAAPGTGGSADIPADKEGGQEEPDAAETEPSTKDEAAGDLSDGSASLEPQEGMYFRAHQAFNPTLARWDVNGTEFEYEAVTCLGKTAAFGSGTLVPTGDAGNYKITWSPDSDEVKHLDTRVTVTEKTFGPAGNADDTASTNKEVQVKLFTEMCGELGDTVLGFVS